MNEHVEKVSFFEVNTTDTLEETPEKRRVDGAIPLTGLIRLASSPGAKITTIIALVSDVSITVKETRMTKEFTWIYKGPLSATALKSYFAQGREVRSK